MLSSLGLASDQETHAQGQTQRGGAAETYTDRLTLSVDADWDP